MNSSPAAITAVSQSRVAAMNCHERQPILKFLIIAAALAGTFFLLPAPHDRAPLSLRSPEASQDRRRLLGLPDPFESFSDPKSTAVKRFAATEEPVTVTIIVSYKSGRGTWSNSIFETGTLWRYGTGRVKYSYNYNAKCNWDKRNKRPPFVVPTGPCLAVAKPQREAYEFEYDCHHAALKRDYPNCKTLNMNDELCQHVSYDARQYYSRTLPNEPYLPLGPRSDSWISFKKIKQREGNDVMFTPLSQRKYVFNAIYSENTDSSRQLLHGIINSHENKLFPKFVQIASKWSKFANNAKSEQLDTDDYVQVLVDSVFTLAPIGHNPESFRLFEAVEAGSIPIMVFDDNYYNHPCKGSLDVWLDSPIIVLNSWSELYPTLHREMKDPEALVYRQQLLRTWYEDYMRKTIGAFENFVLDRSIV